MNRLLVTYTVSGLVLFGSLFSALALTGVLVPGKTVGEIHEEKIIAKAEAVTVYQPPTLEPERVYKISHETPIYTTPSETEGERQLIPANGFFKVLRTLESPEGWVEISVDDGFKTWTMYLEGKDLRWKTLTYIYNPDEMDKKIAADQEKIRKQLGLFARRNRGTPLPPPEPEPKPQTAKEWWAEAGPRFGGGTVANLIGSGLIAGVATLMILGSLAMLTVFRREHAWSRPVRYEELDDQDQFAGDPYEYAPPTGDEDDDPREREDRYRG